MSANRKLQTEIDRVLKKVEEGVEVFDDIWDKVYSASQQSLKEKYEGDLKKEIKKLQRLRDQIKTWIGSNDIRDKSALIEARKLIETKMEQFKVCEKETKTKAYSKEGLARSDLLDPHEQLKQDKRDWLQECIDKLNELIDSTEADIERLSSAKGRKNKEEAEALEAKVARHRHHISKLEQIMRVLDNDSLDPNRVDDVKDDVEYYIERAAEPDGDLEADEEFDIYEELGLDELTAQLLAAPVERPRLPSDSKQSDEPEPEPEEEVVEVREEEEEKSSASGGSKTKKSTPNTLSSLTTIGRQQRKADKAKAAAAAAAAASTPAPAPPAAAAAVAAKAAPAPAPTAPAAATSKFPALSQKKDAKTAAPAASIGSQIQPGTTMASALQNAVRQAPQPTPASAKATASPAAVQPKATPLASQVVQQQAVGRPQETVAAVAAKPVPASPQKQPTPAPAKQQPSPQIRPQQAPSPQLGSSAAPLGGESPRSSVGMPDGQAAAQRSIFNNAEIAAAAAMLRTSMMYAPPAPETDRSKLYHPRNPAPCHPSFPTMPAPILENPALFEKLPADTLFFIFYFQQGTYQQYLAARQLKKHSWRFHKKYSTWFQRHEEPKVSAEDYEEGTYVYFDYESGWCQRIKSEFKFEYAFLEDELAV